MDSEIIENSLDDQVFEKLMSATFPQCERQIILMLRCTDREERHRRMSNHKSLDTFSKNIQSIQGKRSSKIQRIIYAATLGMVSFFAEGNVESADAVHEALAGICKDLEMECIHLADEYDDASLRGDTSRARVIYPSMQQLVCDYVSSPLHGEVLNEVAASLNVAIRYSYLMQTNRFLSAPPEIFRNIFSKLHPHHPGDQDTRKDVHLVDLDSEDLFEELHPADPREATVALDTCILNAETLWWTLKQQPEDIMRLKLITSVFKEVPRYFNHIPQEKTLVSLDNIGYAILRIMELIPKDSPDEEVMAVLKEWSTLMDWWKGCRAEGSESTISTSSSMTTSSLTSGQHESTAATSLEFPVALGQSPVSLKVIGDMEELSIPGDDQSGLSMTDVNAGSALLGNSTYHPIRTSSLTLRALYEGREKQEESSRNLVDAQTTTERVAVCSEHPALIVCAQQPYHSLPGLKHLKLQDGTEVVYDATDKAAICIEVGQRPVYFDIPLGRQSLWISVYYVLLERPNNTEWFYQILTEEMTPGKKLVVISDSEVIATDVDLCNI